MSDILNGHPTGAEADAQLLAEKIKRIRNSRHGTQEQSAPEPAKPAVESAPSEAEKKVFSSAEDILRELDAAKEALMRAQAPAAPEPVNTAPEPEITAPEPEYTATEPEPSAAEPSAEEIYQEVVQRKSVFDSLPDDPAADFLPEDIQPESIPYNEETAAEIAVPAYEPEPVPVRKEIPAEESGREAYAPDAPVKKKKKRTKKKKTFKQRIRGLFPEKGDSVFECIRKVVFLVSIIAIVVCGYMVSDYYLDLWRSKRLNDKVMNMYWTYQDDEAVKPSSVTVINDDGEEEIKQKYSILPGARKLLDMNSEVVGVINIPGTKVNNPVMQADDNDKYLNQKIDGSESRAGEIFLDYRNHFDDIDEEGYLKYPNSDNLIIYGHNMADETMFGSLKYYQRNGDYYGEHPVIELNSNCMTYKYKIFAFFILDAEDESSTKFDCWNKLNFIDEKDFYGFVNEAKRRTIRLNDVDVKYGDKLVTLSTCNTYIGDRGRLIIMGRLVRDGEDPLEGTQNSTGNPNIKWPTLYYNIKKGEKYDPEAEFEPYGP